MSEGLPSDKSISLRDQLKLIADQMIDNSEDREGHVLSCCVALAIEAVEDWMYKGMFTPSVAPFKSGTVFRIPEPEIVRKNICYDDLYECLHTNVEVAKKKKIMTIGEQIVELRESDEAIRMPVLEKLAEKKRKGKKVVVPNELESVGIINWNDALRRYFRMGDDFLFVRELMASFAVCREDAIKYLNIMQKQYPFEWGKIKIPF